MLANKKTLLAALVLASSSFAAAASDDGVEKYSDSLVYLKCIGGACTPGTTTPFRAMTVYYKYEVGTPPHSEARLYWNQNVPAGIAAGRDIAHTVAGACPAGSVNSELTATWYLSDFKPVTAKAVDCDNKEYFYSVHEFDF
ncbi:hypothetical protein [Thalassomonas actiniarum]|uniref:Ig-like domain-containing protein n=1 Tax=Thalassomonas actiniarum TaxID=485447 RepID=A0AAF0C5U5_9GAMM|nr:hypothetical protein [Thalassomonas actiniarum]WDE01275.1 hypothetical protein SG35_011875 [Thalassomonas actiniarum]